MEKIDVVFVNPSNKEKMYGKLGTALAAVEPPIWTGLIAAFIRREGYSVKIIDADAEGWDPEYTARKIIEYNPLLAAIGALGANPSASSTPKMPAVRSILAALGEKAPGIKTALYGIHPSALPKRTLGEEPADFLLRGECFYTILKLLGILKSGKKPKYFYINGLWNTKNGRIISNGWGELVRDLDDLPFIAWDLLPMGKYRAHNWHCFGCLDERQPYAVIYTSIGCPFNCAYCNIHSLYNGKPGIRFRSPAKVVEEIGFLVKNYKVRNIKILDELFVLKEKAVIEFCDLIIKRGYDLNMWAYARVDTVNKELLSRMKKAGINWICYGIESGSKKVRDGVTKGKFGQSAIKKAVEMTHNAGIHVIGNFMFGLPEDTLETMQGTLDMAIELDCEYVNFYTTMAYPGSRLYAETSKNKVKLPDSWLGYSQFSKDALPLPTRHLSSEEVLRFRDMAFEKYYSNPAYLNMIDKKFGQGAAEHIKEILKHKIQRKLLTENKYNRIPSHEKTECLF